MASLADNLEHAVLEQLKRYRHGPLTDAALSQQIRLAVAKVIQQEAFCAKYEGNTTKT